MNIILKSTIPLSKEIKKKINTRKNSNINLILESVKGFDDTDLHTAKKRIYKKKF